MSRPVLLFLHRVAVLLLLATGLACGGASVAAAPSSEEKAQLVIHMLDYVGVDYPAFVQGGKVLDEAEYQEQREFAAQSLALLQQLPPVEGQAALLARARRLLESIDAKAQGADVSALAGGVGADVMRLYRLTVAPRHAPDLARAAPLFQQHCAACHGATGRGDGPAGKGLDPAPSDFHDRARMDQRSLLGLYNTITLGVGGTGMRGYGELSETDRWALAFLVGGMRNAPHALREGERLWTEGKGRVELGRYRALVTTAPGEVLRQGGAELYAVRAWLTAHPEAVAALQPAPLAMARAKIADAVASYRQGDRAAARQHAVTAYLEGFELVEAGLDNVDPGLRTRTEREMMELRTSIDAGHPAANIAAQAARIEELLEAAEERLGPDDMSTGGAFAASLLILLREGLEALLVLAAIIAFVRKTGRRDALPYIHAGWAAAVVLGGITWFAAARLVQVSGASRELTEGVSALVAAAMLLYVGAWLHRRSSAQAWQTFIREKVSAALDRRTLWAMAGVSFLAVYRELFEVVLFYQTLWAQAGPTRQHAVLGGIGTAAALLAGLGWAILRWSVRLPIGPFFAATSGLLALLAFVFVGHGVAALQEAGVLAPTPVPFPFPRIPLLGIEPTVQGLLAQSAVLVGIAATVRPGRRRAVGATAAVVSTDRR